MDNLNSWKTEISKIQKCPQRQDSLQEQLIDLISIANELGFYDASKFIEVIINK